MKNRKINRPGITEAFLVQHGVKHVTDQEAKVLCGKSAQSGVFIPYYTPEGIPLLQKGKPFGRLRLDHPTGSKKYHQEFDTNQEVYFPLKSSIPSKGELIFIEGEFKALSLTEQGFPALGLSGFYAFGKRKGNEDDEFKLNPLLEAFINKHSIHTVCFLGDSDTSINYDFSRAAIQLRKLLPDQIKLKLPRIPLDMPKGVDDCCKSLGDRFRAWMIATLEGSIDVNTLDVDSLQRILLLPEKANLSRMSKLDPEFQQSAHGKLLKLAAAARGKILKEEVNQLNKRVSKLSITAIRNEVKQIEKVKRLANSPDPSTLKLYFDQSADKFAVEPNSGVWLLLNLQKATMALEEMGVSSESGKNNELSPLKKLLGHTICHSHVRTLNRLAGFKSGVRATDTEKLLILHSPKLIEPREGSFETLAAFLEALLATKDNKQLIYFHSWMQAGTKSLRSFDKSHWTRSQAIFFVGPANCGKSLLQSFISELLDRGCGKPFAFMTGQTPFNSDLFDYVHLKMEDEQSKLDMASRREFGTRIKDVTTNRDFHLHQKGKVPIVVPALRRLTISINDEPENMRIIPPIDDSLRDKISILLCAQPEELKGSPEDVRKFIDILMAELPCYLYWLLNEFKIPLEWQDARAGVKAYQSPLVLERIDDQSPESELLEQAGLLICGDHEHNPHRHGIVRLKSYEIMAELKTCPRTRDFAIRNYKFSNSFGRLLARLAKTHPRRVQRNVVHRKEALWSIYLEPQYTTLEELEALQRGE